MLKDLYHYFLIKQSELFDRAYYLKNYPDVRKSDINPLMHFIKFGWKEGRNPSRHFDTNLYRNHYHDVQDAGHNPLINYLNFGKAEHRKAFPVEELAEPIEGQIPVEDQTPISFVFGENEPPTIIHGPVVDREKISVIVTTYNHAEYINECLDSILKQKGDFNLEIIVGDDCSTDSTEAIIRNYAQKYPDVFQFLPNTSNLGVTKNLKRCLDACTGSYIAICEGDDYWIDEYKLQKQMDYLSNHPDASMVFSSIMILFEDDEKIVPFNLEKPLEKTEITTQELIEYNYIGNFSCCMYKANTITKLPPGLFDMFTVDWMFNIACSEIGSVGYINEYMSVYRKHKQGAWAGKQFIERNTELLEHVDVYNAFLEYRYHENFTKLKAGIQHEINHFKDLLILDTVFPHPLSPFRYYEFICLLENFPNALVLTTGEHFPLFKEDKSVDEIIHEFEDSHPEFVGRTVATSHNITPYSANLAYVEFLNNIKAFLPTLEEKGIPFILTLYPGGGFQINHPETDQLLQRVFNSLQFRKVIITQNITREYLLNNQFCTPEQIEFIFGVVLPPQILDENIEKERFGFEKNTLDLCFVAHKYTPGGIDKGYDVFIEVAKQLVNSYNNVFFHVVGSFDENDLSIEGLEGKISFHGLQHPEWFKDFYRDKDIILSPNIPFILQEGSFDGFPTTSSTEAGINEVAMLCTDVLGLNFQFSDWEDIIIIPHDADKITEITTELYKNPAKLKEIAKNGAKKIKEIYSYKNQITPRIKIIQEQLEKESRKW